MDVDEILSDVGEFGKYQKLILWFVLLPGVFPCGFHAYNQIFMAATPDHWCRIPGEDRNGSSDRLDARDGVKKLSGCYMDVGNRSSVSNGSSEDVGGGLVPCKYGWEYDKSVYQSTIVTDWDLVCEDDLAPTLALVLLGIGGLLGNYAFGYVQDGLGRKPAFFIFLLIQCFFGIATSFAPNFLVWSIFRFGVGLTVPAILGTPYVLAVEIVGPKYRTTVTILVNIAYSISLVSLAFVVWAVRDWRTLSMVTTVPFLGLFAFMWLLPESPRWLVAQGKLKQAEEILTTMARVNGGRLNTDHFKQLTTNMSTINPRSSYGVSDLLKTPNLRLKTIIITFIWFTNTSVYVGLSYYAPSLGGNEFLNFFLAGIVELPTYLFLWPALEKWGRRWSLSVSMIIGGSACLATVLVEGDSQVTLALYCIGKMGISSSFVVLPLMASELYPTVVRGLGMSISSVMGMLGPIFIPLVNYLGTEMLTLPLMIMGGMLVAGGACSWLLPETLNKHLPQTLEDGEKTGLDCFDCFVPPNVEERRDSRV